MGFWFTPLFYMAYNARDAKRLITYLYELYETLNDGGSAAAKAKNEFDAHIANSFTMFLKNLCEGTRDHVAELEKYDIQELIDMFLDDISSRKANGLFSYTARDISNAGNGDIQYKSYDRIIDSLYEYVRIVLEEEKLALDTLDAYIEDYTRYYNK